MNVERAPFGGLKLRIPSLLYVEKMRTQTRFNVCAVSYQIPRSCIKTRACWQLMRMEACQSVSASDARAESKSMHNASSKVSVVVHRMLFPLLDSPMRTHILLDTDADQLELELLEHVGRTKPRVLGDEQSFVQHLLSLLERYRRNTGDYQRVPLC